MKKYIVLSIYQDSRSVTLPVELENGIVASSFATAANRAIRSVKGSLRRGVKELAIKIRCV